jgi:hypothetical protein
MTFRWGRIRFSKKEVSGETFSPTRPFKNQSRIKAEFDERRGKAIVD